MEALDFLPLMSYTYLIAITIKIYEAEGSRHVRFFFYTYD